MKVVLLRLALRDGTKPVMPPLSIYSLAACLREQGHEVVVMDPVGTAPDLLTGPDHCQRLLVDADLVGASIDTLNLTTTLSALTNIRQARPELPIVVGGVHATHMPGQVAGQDCVDYVVTGAGEQPLSALVRCLETGDSPDGIPGLYWMENGTMKGTPHQRIRYDGYPVPAYDLIPPGEYQVMPFETSRGCPGKCGFCSISEHNAYYPMPVSMVLKRFDQSTASGHDRYTSDSVFITDDCFTANRLRATRLAQAFADRGYQRRMAIEARVVDLLVPGMIDALNILKPLRIQVGIECGYDEGLRRVGKNITTADVYRCAELLNLAGLGESVMYSFIIGLPWEPMDLCVRTIHFQASLLREFGGIGSLSLFNLCPSLIWDQRLDYGINVSEDIFLSTEETFYTTHPLLDRPSVSHLAGLIRAYEGQGIHMMQRQVNLDGSPVAST